MISPLGCCIRRSSRSMPKLNNGSPKLSTFFNCCERLLLHASPMSEYGIIYYEHKIISARNGECVVNNVFSFFSNIYMSKHDSKHVESESNVDMLWGMIENKDKSLNRDVNPLLEELASNNSD